MTKHVWALDANGNRDDFQFEDDECNGVRCVNCGETFCVHCFRNVDALDGCDPDNPLNAKNILTTQAKRGASE